jgi:hypothetical protein
MIIVSIQINSASEDLSADYRWQDIRSGNDAKSYEVMPETHPKCQRRVTPTKILNNLQEDDLSIS